MSEKRSCWRSVLREAGRQFATATLESFRLHGTATEQAAQEFVLKRIREYCGNIGQTVASGGNVVLVGPCGTGKDHLVIAMLRKVIEAGCIDLLWVDAAEMFGQFKDAISIGRDITELITRLVAPQSLVISDLVPGSEALTQFEADILFRVLNSRWRHDRATWANANVTSREELETKIPKKCVSRLFDGAFTLRTQWSDYRKIGNTAGAQ